MMRFQRGRVGNVIYRRWGKDTVASKAPDFRGHRWSKAQKANRHRFSDATAYARQVLENPGLFQYYRKKVKRKQTVWNVAIADYMKRPEICSIDLCREWKDDPEQFVKVDADDNYQVTGVIITILNALGLVVESGSAEMNNDGEWIYKMEAPVSEWEGGKIEVSVRDLPGNEVKGWKMLDGS
jgi:hypothetical protein